MQSLLFVSLNPNRFILNMQNYSWKYDIYRWCDTLDNATDINKKYYIIIIKNITLFQLLLAINHHYYIIFD